MAQKAGTAVPDSGTPAKVFPPLDPGTFAPQLVWLALTFGLLYLLLKRVALPRVGEVIEERADRIKRDLEQAEKLKADTEAALADYEQALGEARAKANAMAKGMRDTLTAEVDKERAKVDAADRRQACRSRAPHRRHQGQGARRRRRHRRRGGGRHRLPAHRQRGEQGRGEEGAGAARSGVGAWSTMLGMAEFWVAVAFVAFLAILVYYKVPKLIAKALDDRADAIRKELDEARRLREEAQTLLADYQKRHRNVGQEAEAIVDQARREAEAFAHETRASLKDALERRTKLAEDKIARAEAQAVDEVRASASTWRWRRPRRSCARRWPAPAAPRSSTRASATSRAG